MVDNIFYGSLTTIETIGTDMSQVQTYETFR